MNREMQPVWDSSGRISERRVGVRCSASPSLINSFDRPMGVFLNQWLGVIKRPLQGGKSLLASDVTQSDACVAQKPPAFCAQHRGVCESTSKCCFVQIQ